LSRAFYEKFGDEIVNELVEWLNRVDLAYRTEFRELNESTIARLEARIDHRAAEVRAELRTELQSLKAEMIKWMLLFWAGTALGGLLLR
jgi:hypothetical protein